MKRWQIKFSFSVGTKLLISIVSLLLITIAFLTASAIIILQEDKRDYTYQSQSTEAVLAGRELVNIARHAMDTLRLSLAYINPINPITPQQSMAFQFVIDNQMEVLAINLNFIDTQTGEAKPYATVAKGKALKDLGIAPQDTEIAPNIVKTLLPELMKNSYAFANISKLGETPILAVMLIDPTLPSTPNALPVATGIVSLNDFAKEFKKSDLTITTKKGRVLYDADPATLFTRPDISDSPLYKTAQAQYVSVGAHEYQINDERYLGTYAHPGLDLVVFAKTEWKKVMKATYALTEKFVLLGLMAIGAAIVFAILFSKTLTAPINRLYKATQEVMNGNFDFSLEVSSSDEIGALTESFNTMSQQITGFIQEKVQSVRIESELAIVSTVQQTLIPPATFRDDKIYIHSAYQPATECGGDWWGFFRTEDKMCVMIADATGHGLPSALITASARSCFSVMHKLSQEDPDFTFSPAAMLGYANRVIYDASLSQIMMTFFIGVIDFKAKTLTYANASHNPPWLFKKNGDKYTLNSLIAVGQRLGESLDSPDFEEKTVAFSEEDILFMYTDGLIEGTNKTGVAYGKKRARQAVEASLDRGPEQIIKTVMEDFFAYNKEKPLDDDITLAVAQFFPKDLNPTQSQPLPPPQPPIAPT